MSFQTPALALFLELAAIPSPPGEERAVADAVRRYLADLGLEADEDGCGPEIGSTMGNIYARLEPTAEGVQVLPRASAALGGMPRGGGLRALEGGARDCRPAPRPSRRGDDRER